MQKSLYIIDGTALIYRSYFAFIRSPLITSTGENTSAVFGFTTSLFRLIKERKPDYLIITFDSKEPTFRHTVYPEYKATRERMPEDMLGSLPRLAQVIEALCITHIECPGYEADDIMGTLAERGYKAGLDVYLVTGDKDLMQLVNDRIFWFNLKRTGVEDEILDPDGIKNKFGVLPKQVVDVLGLMGDHSDNVPGIPGIGGKTAVKLITEFGTMENVLNNVDKISKKSLQEKITQHWELAQLSKQLVTIERNVPVSIDIESCVIGEPDREQVYSLFKELEFNSIAEQYKPVIITVKKPHNYHTILTRSELETLAHTLKQTSGKDIGFVFDIETTGLDILTAEIVGISFAIPRQGGAPGKTEAFYVPFIAPDTPLSVLPVDILNVLKPLLADETISKCGHNLKFDCSILRRYTIPVAGQLYDTMVAAYLLQQDKQEYNLGSLSEEFLKIEKIPIESLIGSGKDQISMAEVPLARIAEYSCEDADCTLQLWQVFEPKLKELGLWKLFSEIEMPLVPILMDMELTGISLDVAFLQELSVKMHRMMNELTKEIYIEAGEEFNIGSPQQLGKILFEKLEIHKLLGNKRAKKTKIGYSTDVNVLEQYRGHPLVSRILEHRQLAKLLSTYIDALPKLIHPKTGRVHTSFNQTITFTGRLSSTNPNLQNIPIRTEIGREIRKAFIPRDASWRIISADYSQIDLRVMADMSNDDKMRQAFINGADIHTMTAARIFGVNENDVTPEMRHRAKATNFGIIYGMTQYGLAKQLNISNDEAVAFITAYFTLFPAINEYRINRIAKACNDGYVTTLMGRRRYLPELFSDNQHLRKSAENMAINTPIQGTAAEIIKKAMISLSDILRKQGFQAKLLLQIHDELVLEAPEVEVNALNIVVKDCMEHTVSLSVPLKVEVRSGQNWLDAH